MTSEVPSHHLKQSICATRPPYRDGRRPKAVKVYTVNNESCYILIQGVPSVGANQELQKLCESFGSVGQFSPLDDYPCEDKYSETYLVKYSKIQSARYAKRKLDDYSFFGGVLHVCYSPEYESVAETREKLQDRRRIIATKIRQFAEGTGKQLALPSGTLQHADHLTDKSVKISANQLCLQEQQNSPAEDQLNQLRTPSTFSITSTSNITPGVEPSKSGLPDITHKTSNTIQPVFELLPPPKSEISHFRQGSKSNAYEFSRVRSAHATFPPGYDARLTPDIPKQSSHSDNLCQTADQSHGDVPQSQTHLVLSTEPPSHPTAGNSSSFIVRDYKPSKPPPRFVPRQAVKNQPDPTGSGSSLKRRPDTLDQEIRKNAFHLGKTQGPALVPPRKRVFSSSQQSVNETIIEIRNKISRVITDSVKQCNDVVRKNL